MANLFLVKQRLVDPSRPFVRFKPAMTTVLVGAKTKAKAQQMAYDNLLQKMRVKFPTVDLKFVNIQTINYDDFYQ